MLSLLKVKCHFLVEALRKKFITQSFCMVFSVSLRFRVLEVADSGDYKFVSISSLIGQWNFQVVYKDIKIRWRSNRDVQPSLKQEFALRTGNNLQVTKRGLSEQNLVVFTYSFCIFP